MAQKEIVEKGVKKLLVYHNLRSSIDDSIRIQSKKRYVDVELGSKKAEKLEKDLLRQCERKLTFLENAGITWSKLLEKYEEEVTPLVLRGDWMQSRQTFSEAMNSLHKWTKSWMNKPACEVTTADVKRLFHQVKGEGLADATIGKLRGDIRKVFEFGIVENLVKGINRSPTEGVSVKSRARMRKEILSSDEIKKLLAYAREYEPDWYYIWGFAVYTGARNGELYSLKWTDVEEQDGLIHIQRSYNRKYKIYKETKTGEWRDVSICAPLQEILNELKARRLHDEKRGVLKNPEFVLPRPGLWQNGEQAKRLRLFCEEIGIPPICFHSLRACFATELLRRGVPVAKVMRVGGWSSMKTMMHYVRLSGIEIQGITDPLDFRTASPNRISEGEKLMQAVGATYNHGEYENVIALASRRLPRGLTP